MPKKSNYNLKCKAINCLEQNPIKKVIEDLNNSIKNEMTNMFYNSNLASIMNEANKTQDMITKSLKHMNFGSSDLASLTDRLTKNQDMMSKALEHMNFGGSGLTSLADRLTKSQKDIMTKSLERMNSSNSGFASLTDALAKNQDLMSKALEHMNFGGASFALIANEMKTLNNYHMLAEESTKIDFSRIAYENIQDEPTYEEHILNCLNKISEQLNEILNSLSLPKKKVLLDILCPFLFSLFLHIISLQGSNRIEEKVDINLQVSNRIEEKVDSIAETFSKGKKQIELDSKEKTFFKVKRLTTINEKKTYKSQAFDYLSPGSEVLLLESDKKWIKIEYYNPFENRVSKGWVLKKYLKRID